MSAVKPSAVASRFSRLRFATVVLLGVYPIVTGLLYALAPLTAGWPLWQRTLILAPTMVAIMVWGLIPTIQSRLAGWLQVPVADDARLAPAPRLGQTRTGSSRAG